MGFLGGRAGVAADQRAEHADVLDVSRDNREWIAHGGKGSIGREGDQSLPGSGEIAHNYTDTQQATRPRPIYLHPPSTSPSPLTRTRRSQ